MSIQILFPKAAVNSFIRAQSAVLPSRFLNRQVNLLMYYPGHVAGPLSLLLLNDGQDAEALQLEKVVNKLALQGKIKPLLVIAIHAGERLQEYGIAGSPDYKKRGSKAAAYTNFIIEELMPWLKHQFPISTKVEDRVVAGFSLGGLSAFDLAWQNPGKFGAVGVFSGSFWWRSKGLNDGYTDADRLAHQMVRMGKIRPGLKFWLEVGTEDEKCDRNHNGVIDSIDDTLDLVTELILKGYALNRDITYVEVQGGKHDYHTWAKLLPDFLCWSFKPE
jgi:enterochelin esterase family protein